MPRTIRFYLDENCARAIAQGLTRRGTGKGRRTVRSWSTMEQ
jgi:hypothetical protein